MTDQERERILDNARYLRNVRPIDPEEIYEYVESQPHPAIVRQVLREEAFDLGLVERPDGTFEPAGEDPLAPSFAGVERFPVEYGRRLEDLLVEAFGPDWHRGDSAERLREVVRRTKEAYLRGSAVEYDEETALGYAVYHLPDYYAVIQYVLDELGSQGLLPRTLRVLDVGAGTGGPALGLFDYLGDDALVDYHAVEPNDAADVLAEMLSAAPRNVHATVHRETAEAFEPDGPYDLVLFANVLSELDDPTAVVERYLDAVADDGTLAALAPADLETSTGLRDVERALDDRAEVFSPTLRLWPGESPADRGWSFAVKPDLEVPPVQQKLDDGSGEFVNVDVQYSHFLLRPDGRRRLDVRADPAQHAKMSEMDDHVTERVDLLAVKLSENLAEADANPLFKLSDGSEQVGNFAVLTKRTALNRDLLAAEYGDVLVFEGALVLWNDDEEAYNLVVDDETVVDRVPAP